MDDEDAEDSQQWHGNVRRKMWKSVCHRAALNVRLFLRVSYPSTRLPRVGTTLDGTLPDGARALRGSRTDCIHVCRAQGRLQDVGGPPLGPGECCV